MAITWKQGKPVDGLLPYRLGYSGTTEIAMICYDLNGEAKGTVTVTRRREQIKVGFDCPHDLAEKIAESIYLALKP